MIGLLRAYSGATACVGALNNRWFAGKQISAAYVPEADFESI